MKLDFTDCLAIADCAAKRFAEMRTSANREDSAKLRSYMRENAVRSLRFLWRNGDASNRSTVAARIAIWMYRPQNSEAIYKREKLRLKES